MITTTDPNLNIIQYGNNIPYMAVNKVDGRNPGDMWFNPDTTSIEVWDGYNWYDITYDAEIMMDSHASKAMEWAKKKMLEEEEYEALAKESEAVRIAMENVEEAKRKLQITAHLARKYDKTTS